MKLNKVTPGGEVKVVDSKNFLATMITAAIVTLKPGGLRELHWHPHADEWQYYVTVQARMTVFIAGAEARTMDFQAGDVGYIPISNPHYIENTGDSDLVFLEMFKTTTYADISFGEWLAHTPPRLVNEHLQVGEARLAKMQKQEMVITPIWKRKSIRVERCVGVLILRSSMCGSSIDWKRICDRDLRKMDTQIFTFAVSTTPAARTSTSES